MKCACLGKHRKDFEETSKAWEPPGGVEARNRSCWTMECEGTRLKSHWLWVVFITGVCREEERAWS